MWASSEFRPFLRFHHLWRNLFFFESTLWYVRLSGRKKDWARGSIWYLNLWTTVMTINGKLSTIDCIVWKTNICICVKSASRLSIALSSITFHFSLYMIVKWQILSKNERKFDDIWKYSSSSLLYVVIFLGFGSMVYLFTQKF